MQLLLYDLRFFKAMRACNGNAELDVNGDNCRCIQSAIVNGDEDVET